MTQLRGFLLRLSLAAAAMVGVFARADRYAEGAAIGRANSAPPHGADSDSKHYVPPYSGPGQYDHGHLGNNRVVRITQPSLGQQYSNEDLIMVELCITEVDPLPAVMMVSLLGFDPKKHISNKFSLRAHSQVRKDQLIHERRRARNPLSVSDDDQSSKTTKKQQCHSYVLYYDIRDVPMATGFYFIRLTISTALGQKQIAISEQFVITTIGAQAVENPKNRAVESLQIDTNIRDCRVQLARIAMTQNTYVRPDTAQSARPKHHHKRGEPRTLQFMVTYQDTGLTKPMEVVHSSRQLPLQPGEMTVESKEQALAPSFTEHAYYRFSVDGGPFLLHATLDGEEIYTARSECQHPRVEMATV